VLLPPVVQLNVPAWSTRLPPMVRMKLLPLPAFRMPEAPVLPSVKSPATEVRFPPRLNVVAEEPWPGQFQVKLPNGWAKLVAVGRAAVTPSTSQVEVAAQLAVGMFPPSRACWYLPPALKAIVPLLLVSVPPS